LVAAGVAIGALVVLAAVLLVDLEDDGGRDRPTPLPAVGSVPTPTSVPSEASGFIAPAKPTATEEAAAEPTPSRTPNPTRTPESAAESRPTATTEPEPTETTEPTEAPTATAVPTEEPTDTPEPPTPTEELEPTSTTEPTATATATAETVEESRAIGSREAGTGSAGQVLPSARQTGDGTAFDATAWVGGQYDAGSLGRPATVLDGRGARDRQATLTFQLNDVPELGLLLRFDLFVPDGGMSTGFLVEVNGMPFGLAGGGGGAALPPGWTPVEIEVPVDLLGSGENVVTVRYDAPAGQPGQDAAIGLGGGEIAPIDGGTAGGDTTTGLSSSTLSGSIASDDEPNSGEGGESREEEDDDGPREAPTIAPRSTR
jgi:hypothetical protein